MRDFTFIISIEDFVTRRVGVTFSLDEYIGTIMNRRNEQIY